MSVKAAESPIVEQLNRVPASPGVYQMRDAGGNILYVGKAANLYHRVRSYFGAGQKLTPKMENMVSRVADIDFYVTSSEQEALILEATLIKRHHPHYNVNLKDDKSFPYLKISTGEEWPRIYSTRRLEPDGARYFGPFASARSLKQTLKVIKRIFPFRNCSRKITGTDRRACLEYYLGHCVAPCIGAVNHREYAEVIKEVILFLEGKQEKIIRELERKMKRAAEELDFERAARLRDQVQSIRGVIEGQKIAATVRGEQDAVAFVQDRDQAYVQVFLVRSNRLTGRESFVLRGTRQETPSRIMADFIQQFYSASPQVPPRLLLQHPPEDAGVIREWLGSKRGGPVSIQVPRRGVKKQLIDIVAENARYGLEQLKIKQLSGPRVLETALEEIEKELGLPGLPERMEAYDISNIQGQSAVGSMVVFENGKSKPEHYRRFGIRTVAGADDYAMLREVIGRRFRRAAREGSGGSGWAIMPDLVLIDGGRGQLNAAVAVMEALGVDQVPVASLAKENEEIFVPGRAKPIVLSRSSPGLQLLERLRDEAHRFAVTYFQKVHKRRTFGSALDGVPGIGPKRRRALLKAFGSVRAIREAPVAELAAAGKITETLARKVKEAL